MTRFLKIISVLFLMVCTCGCMRNYEPEENTRTLIVYMVADNNLDYKARYDIIEMETAWNDSYKGNIVVFLNDSGGKNTLYHIRKNEIGYEIKSDIIKKYDDGCHVCDPSFMSQVISDAMGFYPADSYALCLWSHGTGWLPNGSYYPLQSPNANVDGEMKRNKELTVFGEDETNNESMEVYDLAKALSQFKFEYIIMDACNMGSIECVYQLRNYCKYCISSAAEILTDGFPYDRAMPYFFSKDEEDIINIAKEFYMYYISRTATISVIDCSKLGNVASELRRIVTKNPEIPFSSIQQYGREQTGYQECIYDLEDFVIQTWGTTTSSSFSDALSRAVLYKANTRTLFSGDIIVNHHCGVSCYIPKSDQVNTLKIYNEKYSWATDSGLGKMLD